MKKIFSTVLAAATLLSSSIVGVPVSADGKGEMPFKDVESGAWYYDEVKKVYESGYMTGTDKTTFAPDSQITRAEAVTIFYRIAGAWQTGLGWKLPFTDTDKDAWYADYLSWAYEEKLVGGYPEGDFRPDQPVSRQELAKMIVDLMRYLVAKSELDPIVDKFTDEDSFPEWSADYIEKLRDSGIMGGDNGRFAPENTATRAEVAAVINRMAPAVEKAMIPLTPHMGWSSWNISTLFTSESFLISQMDAMKELGLIDVGYSYVNIDDGWMDGRDATTGRVKVNYDFFPHGMKYIADEAHKRGLKAGLYTDVGTNTCGAFSNKRGGEEATWGVDVGLYEHEEDLWMYFGDGKYMDEYARGGGDDGVECWGFDFIKVDSNGTGIGIMPEIQHPIYQRVIDEVERATGKRKYFNICRWFYDGPYLLNNGTSFRSGVDLCPGDPFSAIVTQIEKYKRIGVLVKPGTYADPDFLLIGLGHPTVEEQSQFAMWCMLSAPLTLSCDLAKISPETLETIKNTELIALDQDKLGRAAAYIKNVGETTELWFKKTTSEDTGDGAVALFNPGDTEETVTLNLSDICVSGKANLRDIIKREDIGERSTYTVTVPAHGTVVLKTDTDKGYTSSNYHLYMPGEVEFDSPMLEVQNIDGETAKKYMKKAGAFNTLLIDVRSEEEFAAGHIDGAINIPYNKLVEKSYLFPVQSAGEFLTATTHLIVYGSDDKDDRIQRACLVLQRIYPNFTKATICSLGGMENYYK